MKNNVARLKSKPQYMLTYFCHHCQNDFAVSELDKPICFYCDSQNQADFELVKKEKLTPAVIAARLKKVADRMMENLKMAYEVGQADPDFDETLMLKTLDRANKYRKKIKNLKLSGSKKLKK